MSLCSFAIIDEEEYVRNKQSILVDDVLQTLQQLAQYHREQLKMPIIGITGTNGKTTSKELINCVLSQNFNVTATKGNLNNHIGKYSNSISLEKYSKAIYFLEIQTDDGIVNKKLILQ